MNAQGLFSVGGIASGLDTNAIVDQLLALERQPIARLEQQQSKLQTSRDAWGQINTKLSSLRTATDQLRRPDRFANMVKVSSSDPDAVSVTRSGRPTDGASQSFTVEALARREQQSSIDAFTGLDAALGGREFAIVVDGETHDLTGELGPDATLGDLIGAINDADLGVRASSLQVSNGQHQLVLTATATGTEAAAAYTIEAANGWTDAVTVTQDAADAHLRVGGIDVFRSSNTIDDLIDGASITLTRTTDQPVTVSAAQDVDGAVEAVEGYVEALNGVLSTISELTAFNPETKVAGPLQGQFAATQLAFSLRSAVSSPVQGLSGMASLASSVGITLTQDGSVELDEARLRQAFTDDFDGTAQLFARSGTATSESVTSVFGTSDTSPGTFDVEISRAADIARITGATAFPAGSGEPKTFMIRSPNGTIVTVTMDSREETVVSAAAKIQAALDDAGVTDLNASYVGHDETGNLVLESTRYGSAVSFEVAELAVDVDGNPLLDEAGEYVVKANGAVFGLEGTHAGVDVQGTITRAGQAPGELLTGSGRTLTASDEVSRGLAVTVDGQPDEPFQVSFWHGIGGAMDLELSKAEGIGGTIARARSSLESQINQYTSRIETFEARVESREVTLRRQFVGLETAIARFNAQSEWLSGQIAQLNAISAQGSARRR